jgi:hypothetical protein
MGNQKLQFEEEQTIQAMVDRKQQIAKERERVLMFNAIFKIITVISWQSVLLVEETGIPHRQTCSTLLKKDDCLSL